MPPVNESNCLTTAPTNSLAKYGTSQMEKRKQAEVDGE
jgi:hypothetical protein